MATQVISISDVDLNTNLFVSNARVHLPDTVEAVNFLAGGLGSDQNDYTPVAESAANYNIMTVQANFLDSDPEKINESLGLWYDRAVQFIYLVNNFLTDPGNSSKAGVDFTQYDSLPIFLSGHSFGAGTASIASGMRVVPTGQSASVRRTTSKKPLAAFLMSGQGIEEYTDASSWLNMNCPLWSMTGTKDPTRIGEDWIKRMEPWELTPDSLVYHYSIAIAGAHNHGGITGVGDEDAVLKAGAITLMGRFWDYYLNGVQDFVTSDPPTRWTHRTKGLTPAGVVV